jgi:transposase InsO family protein
MFLVDRDLKRDALVTGSQFTSITFTGLLLKNEIKISMDGKGAWRDNIFIERLWRTIKYEEVYLTGLRQCLGGTGLHWPL